MCLTCHIYPATEREDYYLHFPGGETGSERPSESPKVTQLGRGRFGWNSESWFFQSCLATLCQSTGFPVAPVAGCSQPPYSPLPCPGDMLLLPGGAQSPDLPDLHLDGSCPHGPWLWRGYVHTRQAPHRAPSPAPSSFQGHVCREPWDSHHTVVGEHKETWAQPGGLTHPQGARALGPEAWKASKGGDNLQGLALKDEPQVKWQLSISAAQGITLAPQALRFWLSRPWEGPRLW